MRGFNKVILAGNLTRDPELRHTPNGNAVCSIGLAINRTWTQDGQKKEECVFVDCEAWGKTAENAAQYLRKGSGLLVEGRLTQNEFTNKQGQKVSKTRVAVESMTMLGGKQGAQPASRPAQAPAAPKTEEQPSDEDDVPF